MKKVIDYLYLEKVKKVECDEHFEVINE